MRERFEKYIPKEYFAIALLIFGGILFYFLLSHLEQVFSWIGWFLGIFKPFFWAIIIAYFINFIVGFFERRVFFKVKKAKHRRIFAMICAYILALIIIVLVIAIIVPQTINSFFALIDNTPTYINNFVTFVSGYAATHSWAMNISDWMTPRLMEIQDTIPTFVTDKVLPYTVDFTTAAAGWIINLLIAIIASVYMIFSKERFFAQIKKALYAHLSVERVDRMIELSGLTNETFSNFISGKCIDSLIIGILSFICLSFFNFPYALLISVIIGITNIIPFFGPIIGAVPSIIIIAIVDPGKALWFLLFILILQQVDGNIIGPKILGYSIGLSAIWIIFAIVVGNELIGFIGMVIGVPVFAICYMLFKEWSERKLKEKGLSTKTEDYAGDKNKLRF